jgi:hypothetical protein
MPGAFQQASFSAIERIGAACIAVVTLVRTIWSRLVAAGITNTVSAIAAAAVISGFTAVGGCIGVALIVSVTVTVGNAALPVNYVEMLSKKSSCALTLVDSRPPYGEVRERSVFGQLALNVCVGLPPNVSDDAVLSGGGLRRQPCGRRHKHTAWR